MIVRSRASWHPAPPHNVHQACSWKHDPVRLHHTAITFKYQSRRRSKRIAEEKEHMRLLQRVAFGRGYSDISYSYVAFPSGRIYIGRGEQILGAHTLHHNDEPAICLAGNFEYQKVSRRCRLSVSRLVRGRLHKRFGCRRRLVPHCATYATSCPGKNARAAFKLSCG